MNKAENLTSDRYTIPPSRGQIFDRNGTLMVGSEATHDLMVTPKSLPDNLEWQADAARWAGMSEDDLKKALRKARRYSSYKASPVRKGLSIEAHALMAAELHRFPGFQFRTRPVRNHINKSAGHLLGEYAETSPEDLKADRFYSMGDRIGRSGLEQCMNSNCAVSRAGNPSWWTCGTGSGMWAPHKKETGLQKPGRTFT